MSRVYILEQVTDGVSEKLDRLEGEVVKIGRELDEEGIEIDSSAVSRTHGLFFQQRGHCLFKDLGSTNGSWLNGDKLSADRYYPVRVGDFLQLGDLVLKLGVEDSSGTAWSGQLPQTPTSLVVMSAGNIIDEFPVPEYGRALVVGGAQSDLELEGDLYEHPSLVVERRGQEIVAFSMTREVPIQINGVSVDSDGIHNLADRDLVEISNYSIIFNGLDSWSSGRQKPESGAEAAPPESSGSSDQGPSEKEIEESLSVTAEKQERRQPISPLFGTSVMAGGEPDSTVMIDERTAEAGASRYRSHPAMRGFSKSSGDSEIDVASIEDRVVLVVCLVLVLALIGLVVWWVVS